MGSQLMRLNPQTNQYEVVGASSGGYNLSDLATVATSGSYNDLLNKPIIPTAYSLPTASESVLGGIKVGSGLAINNGVLSTSGGGIADSVDWSGVQNKPNYAGSSSIGGSATSSLSCTGNSATATALTTSAGSVTQPIYFKDGKPTATSFTLSTSVPSGAKFTDTTYTNATTSVAGLMSTTDKTKLDGIATDANKTTVDTALSSTSTNPVQNKVITSSAGVSTLINQLTTASGAPVDADYFVSQYTGGGTSNITYYRRPFSTLWSYIKGKADSIYATVSHTHTKSQITDFPTLSTVATSGSYNDLSNKPTIPSAYSLPTASASVLGGVKTGSNITNTSGVLSLTKANVTSALGYTPPTTNTTYADATTSAHGLMTATDKTKLNGIATGANAYSLPTASASTLGGVKVGAGLSISNGVLSASGGSSGSSGSVFIIEGTVNCTMGIFSNIAITTLPGNILNYLDSCTSEVMPILKLVDNQAPEYSYWLQPFAHEGVDTGDSYQEINFYAIDGTGADYNYGTLTNNFVRIYTSDEWDTLGCTLTVKGGIQYTANTTAPTTLTDGMLYCIYE